jgi:transposase
MQSMLKLLIYGYMSGITSCRNLETICKENLGTVQ